MFVFICKVKAQFCAVIVRANVCFIVANTYSTCNARKKRGAKYTKEGMNKELQFSKIVSAIYKLPITMYH